MATPAAAAAPGSATAATPTATAAAAPLVPLAALLAALDNHKDGALALTLPMPLPLSLPRAVGHYRRLEVCVHGLVRAVLTLTPRLAFITVQQCDSEREAAEAAAAAAGCSAAVAPVRLVQVVLKLNDGTGFSAQQQAACKAQLRVGQTICLHAFVEINPPTATPAAAATTVTATAAAATNPVAAAAASSSSSPAASASPPPPAAALETASLAWEVRAVAPIAAAACDQTLAATAAAAAADNAASPAQLAPLPPVEARLSLHAISIVLGSVAGSAESDATTGADDDALLHVGTDRCCQHAAIHSARYAAALAEAAAAADAAAASAASAASSADAAPVTAAASESAAPAASSAESSPLAPPSPPRAFPDIALALRERVEMAAAADAKRAAAAASAAAASNGSEPDRPLSLKEQQKLLNKEKQKGDPRKRAPKCNMNRGLKFYQFLESTFGVALLSQGCGALDVAGGQGIVSWELSKRDLPTVVVDPRPISGAWTQRRARYLNIRKKIAQELGSRPEPTFRHLQCMFDASFLTGEATRSVWESAPLVVGMHPDEATDPIVHLSLAAGKPWAVIPCCVFPGLHPHRRTRDGQLVKTHEQLCEYYLALDPGVRRAQLDFEGRNTVIYSLGKSATAAEGSTASAAAAAAATAPPAAEGADGAIDALVSATAAATIAAPSSSSSSSSSPLAPQTHQL